MMSRQQIRRRLFDKTRIERRKQIKLFGARQYKRRLCMVNHEAYHLRHPNMPAMEIFG